MGIKLEQRLSKLEDEVLALKSTYNIYGGLVQCYMNQFSVDIQPGIRAEVQVRFTPAYTSSDKILVFGLYLNAVHNGIVMSLDDAYIDVQTSKDGITLNFVTYLDGTTNITLLTPMPGTFTRLV